MKLTLAYVEMFQKLLKLDNILEDFSVAGG